MQLAFFHETVVVAHHQVGFDLLQSVKGNADHDDKSSSAKIERQVEDLDHHFRQQGDEGEEDRARQSDPGKNRADVFSGFLAGLFARDMSAVLHHIFRHLSGVKHDRGVEIGKEDDHGHIDHGINTMPGTEPLQQGVQEATGLCAAANDGDQGGGKHQDGLGKDDGNHTGGVDPQGNIGALPAINTASHNAFGILHRYLADGFGHKDHGSRHYHHDRHGYQRHQYAADACLSLEHTHESLGIAGDDTGKDDQGYSVADAMFGDLLTQPHHDHGARDQGHDAGEVEEETGANHHRTGGAGHGGKANRDGHSVEGSQQHSAIAGNLVDLLLAVRAFFA